MSGTVVTSIETMSLLDALVVIHWFIRELNDQRLCNFLYLPVRFDVRLETDVPDWPVSHGVIVYPSQEMTGLWIHTMTNLDFLAIPDGDMDLSVGLSITDNHGIDL
jgi:hypothetical protein